jgi:hypothetical protein
MIVLLEILMVEWLGRAEHQDYLVSEPARDPQWPLNSASSV